MAGIEQALIASANGDFGLTLLAFLILTLVGIFIWSMKTVLNQNSAFNSQVVQKLEDIVKGMKEYKIDTCAALEKHDEQAKDILRTVDRIETTLENRPCISGDRK